MQTRIEDQHYEGFIASTYRIDPLAIRHPSDSQPRPRDLEARYITRLGLPLRKQPEELYGILNRQTQETFITAKKNVKENKPSQYVSVTEKYKASNNCRCVYYRMKADASDISGPVEPQLPPDFTKIFLNLQRLTEYNSHNYTTLRPFRSTTPRDDLRFDSGFECGNLVAAFRLSETEYHLFMQNDINTRGYSQWFNFSIEGMLPSVEYTFKICNFKKKRLMWRLGMKPWLLSLKSQGQVPWIDNVKYRPSNVCDDGSKQPYYELSFTIRCKHLNDYLMVAMSPPYSYSRMIRMIRQLQPPSHTILQKQILAYTLSNNAMPFLTITGKGNQTSKKIIMIIARQHPGEVWSSFLMESLLGQLTSSTEQIRELLSRYIFKVVPMINIDGVIYGNFRCDISGMDLNRQWKVPSRLLHPQIWALKNQLYKLAKMDNFCSFIDLHGHSKKLNTFFYSCREDPESCRVLPMIMSKLTPILHFPECTFGIDRTKENTARAFVYEASKKVNCMTLEISFFGTDRLKREKKPIEIAPYRLKHFKELSNALLEALLIFDGAKTHSQISKTIIQQIIHSKVREYIHQDRRNECDSGSESDPYSDQMDENECQQVLGGDMLKVVRVEREVRRRQLRKTTESSIKLTADEIINIKERKSLPVKYRQQKKIQKQKSKQKPQRDKLQRLPISQSNQKLKESYPSRSNKINQPVDSRMTTNYEDINKMIEEQPRFMFRTRNAIFTTKPNTKPSYKQFSFVESEEKTVNLPRHNRILATSHGHVRRDMTPHEIKNSKMHKEKNKNLLNTFNDEIMSKKIEKQINPYLQPRNFDFIEESNTKFSLRDRINSIQNSFLPTEDMAPRQLEPLNRQKPLTIFYGRPTWNFSVSIDAKSRRRQQNRALNKSSNMMSQYNRLLQMSDGIDDSIL